MKAAITQADKVRTLSQRMKARHLADQHNVSLRTAQRWIQCGADPSAFRTVVGNDGKTYHLRPNAHGHANQVPRALRSVDRALDALERAAAAHGITDADAARLDRIAGRVCDVSAGWRTALAADDQKGGKA